LTITSSSISVSKPFQTGTIVFTFLPSNAGVGNIPSEARNLLLHGKADSQPGVTNTSCGEL
jgi:hypothetical protein